MGVGGREVKVWGGYGVGDRAGALFSPLSREVAGSFFQRRNKGVAYIRVRAQHEGRKKGIPWGGGGHRGLGHRGAG